MGSAERGGLGEIRRLARAEGLSVKAIVRRTGISRKAVRRALASQGAPKYARLTADVAGLPTGRLVAFIDSVKGRFGVEPVCRVLSEYVVKIATSTYYPFKRRSPSPRTLRDEDLSVEIYRIRPDRDLRRGPVLARCGTCCAARASPPTAAGTGRRCRGARWNA
jgi:hypothetical protein